MPRRVLDGIRVLDLGRFIAAPYCGMLLADMGADVIRIEPPGGAEDRWIGLTAANGENFVYPSLARNKKAVTLDVKSGAGRGVLDDLVRRSNVLLHNFSPGAAAALGLSYDDVRAMRADIIYTAISCYGMDGPYADRLGFDPIAQVGSGAAALSGFAGEPPLRCGVPWTDYSTGLCAAFGTVLALRHRDATGEGQVVDCSLMQLAVSYTAPMVAEAVVGGRERPRLGNRAAYLGATDLYRCRDGYVYVAPVTEAAWRALVAVIGHPELAGAADLRTHRERFEHRERIDGLVAAWIEPRDADEIVAALQAARIPCGAYRSTAQVPADPQVQARRMLEHVDLETDGLDRMPVGGVPLRLTATPGAIVSRPPRVGEHNDAVYRHLLGYDDGRLAALRSDGVI